MPRTKSQFVLPPAPTFERERELVALGYTRIAGVDEAGRGPLAGPVVAGAAIVPFDFSSPHFSRLNDSKKLDEATREILYEELTPHIEWGVGIVDAATIDEINIRQASWLAMKNAVAALKNVPDYVLIDGLPYDSGPWPYEALVKGDARSLSIAAASVIAKVTRDRLMLEYDKEFPDYGFARHKGYPAPKHLKALQEHGVCAIHRQTFGPVRTVIEKLNGDALKMPEQVEVSQTKAPQ
ncbi:MAG TPA: ribonuclease HII [Abditibacteriaceae bacterium]|jgi:ribonuclease HII